MDRLVWLGLGLLWSSVAFAQPPGGASDAEEGTAAEGAEAPTDAERDAEGRRLFVAGAEAFTGGHYEVALASFQAAYELTGRAALLYNIGLAHDRLRHDEEALEHFRAYIDQVEALIRETGSGAQVLRRAKRTRARIARLQEQAN